jgi:hypothetical protein
MVVRRLADKGILSVSLFYFDNANLYNVEKELN